MSASMPDPIKWDDGFYIYWTKEKYLLKLHM